MAYHLYDNTSYGISMGLESSYIYDSSDDAPKNLSKEPDLLLSFAKIPELFIVTFRASLR